MKKRRKSRTERRTYTGSDHWWTAAVTPAAIAPALAIAVYINTIHHAFVFDDVEGILNNPLLSKIDGIREALPLLGQTWRPITQFSYGLTRCLFGFDPRAFHLFNVLVHAVNALLVYWIAAKVARLWIADGKSRLFASAAAIIFAVHPLHSEAVAYVWGRSSSLCAMFYFLSLLMVMNAYQEEQRLGRLLWYGGAILTGFMAWMSKEEAITLPLLIAGFFILGRSWRAMAVALVVPIILVVSRYGAIGRLYTEVLENRELASAGFSSALNPLVYFLTHVKYSVFYYLTRFVLPLELNADPTVVPVSRASDYSFIGALLILCVLCAIAIIEARRNQAVAFGMIALLISPLTAYALMPLADVVAEHRVYITGLGFSMIVAWLLSSRPRYARQILVIIAIVFGFLTIQRNMVWTDSLTLWTDAARKSPEHVRPHLNLGYAYQAKGELDAALEEYHRVLSIEPAIAPAYVNMSAIYHSRGDVGRAKQALNRAIELSPNLISPYINLAIIALRESSPDKALEFLDKAASIEDSYLIHFNRGEAFYQLARYRDAIGEYDKAIELEPNIQEMKEQIALRKIRLKELGAIP